MKRIARSTYRWIYYSPLVILFLLMIAAMPSATKGPTGHPPQMPEAVFWLGFLFVAWLFIGRYIALLVLPLTVSHFKCPGCGKHINPVGIWNCGCGYHAHRKRHLLAGVCPKCGVRTGHINCPRCSCTLLLW